MTTVSGHVRRARRAGRRPPQGAVPGQFRKKVMVRCRATRGPSRCFSASEPGTSATPTRPTATGTCEARGEQVRRSVRRASSRLLGRMERCAPGDLDAKRRRRRRCGPPRLRPRGAVPNPRRVLGLGQAGGLGGGHGDRLSNERHRRRRHRGLRRGRRGPCHAHRELGLRTGRYWAWRPVSHRCIVRGRA